MNVKDNIQACYCNQ